ncbi:MAG: DUF1592 domain-containing protein [Myxococcota bacterium]
MPYLESGYAIFEGSLSTALALPYDGTFDPVAAFLPELGGADPIMEVRPRRRRGLHHPRRRRRRGLRRLHLPHRASTTASTRSRSPWPTRTRTGRLLWRAPVVDNARGGPHGPAGGPHGRLRPLCPLRPRRLADPRLCGREPRALRPPRLAPPSPRTRSTGPRASTTPLDAGLDRLGALRHAFKGLLVSPEFVYRFEQDPDGDGVRTLDGYEVATRLAAFAWSSAPDEDLLDDAAAGALDTPEGVRDALGRLMADERAEALVDNLAGQWFSIRDLERTTADATLYPEFDDALRASMQLELRHLMRGFFRDGKPLVDILTAQDAYLDDRLADFYGVPLRGDDPAEVSLAGTGRVGLFGTAGWLKAHSRVDAPSAVKRGKWILENLLCSPPPPPPPNVESMVVIVPEGASVREQEEAQRSDDYCQGCHQYMDPLGFALWDYDAIGAWRTEDELGFPIDSETSMGGQALQGVEDVATWVATDPRLPKCVVQKSMTYALGRPLDLHDEPAIDAVTEAFVAGGETFDALATALVQTDAFRRRGAPQEVE